MVIECLETFYLSGQLFTTSPETKYKYIFSGLKRFCAGRQLEQCVNCSSSSHPFNSEPAGPFDDVVDDDDDDNDNGNPSAMMMLVTVFIAELNAVSRSF